MTLMLAILAAPDAHASRDHAGRFVVDNERFSAVFAYVDGRPLGAVEPASSEVFTVPTGFHRFEVRCAAGNPLFRDEELLRPRELVRAEIAAWEGKLAIENETHRGGTLYVDGEDRGWLAPGAERLLVLPPGPAEVVLRDGALVLDRETAHVHSGRYGEVDLEPPAFAELVLVNPLPVAVLVELDAGRTLHLAPGERESVARVAVGEVTVTVRLPDGRVIERREVRVAPYEGGRLTLSPPDSAPLALHNASARTLTVRADGRVVATLRPRGDAVVELPVGSARIEVLDDRGRTLRTLRVEIAPFADNELAVGGNGARAEYRDEHRRPSSCEL